MGPTDSSYDNAPAVNCSTPNVGKDCTDPPVQCGNTRCAMDNQVPYWDSFGLDWLAGGGTSAENLGSWARLQHSHKHGLGVMTTEYGRRDTQPYCEPFAQTVAAQVDSFAWEVRFNSISIPF